MQRNFELPPGARVEFEVEQDGPFFLHAGQTVHNPAAPNCRCLICTGELHGPTPVSPRHKMPETKDQNPPLLFPDPSPLLPVAAPYRYRMRRRLVKPGSPEPGWLAEARRAGEHKPLPTWMTEEDPK